MSSVVNNSPMDGFNKSLEELLHFADTLRLREKELEQQYNLELEKQKKEYEIQIQIEKRRTENVQEINRTLTEQVERAAQKQVDSDHNYTVLLTKHNCCLEELKQFKELHNGKKLRIEELEKITRILTNEKTKLDNEIKRLTADNQTLQDKLKEKTPSPSSSSLLSQPPSTTTSERVPDEFIQLAEKAVAENNDLKQLLNARDNEIQMLQQQLKQSQTEDPKFVEQRLLLLIAKLKDDFRIMYEKQSNFFLQKIDLLKQEQRDNIASLYTH